MYFKLKVDSFTITEEIYYTNLNHKFKDFLKKEVKTLPLMFVVFFIPIIILC